MPNALDKIRRRAVEITKKHPGKKYQTALKEAGREYKAGKLGGTKKKSSRSHAAKKNKGRKIGTAGTGSARQEYIKEVSAKLGRWMVMYEWATTKTAKRQILKRIAEYKRELRALKK